MNSKHLQTKNYKISDFSQSESHPFIVAIESNLLELLNLYPKTFTQSKGDLHAFKTDDDNNRILDSIKNCYVRSPYQAFMEFVNNVNALKSDGDWDCAKNQLSALPNDLEPLIKWYEKEIDNLKSHNSNSNDFQSNSDMINARKSVLINIGNLLNSKKQYERRLDSGECSKQVRVSNCPENIKEFSQVLATKDPKRNRIPKVSQAKIQKRKERNLPCKKSTLVAFERNLRKTAGKNITAKSDEIESNCKSFFKQKNDEIQFILPSKDNQFENSSRLPLLNLQLTSSKSTEFLTDRNSINSSVSLKKTNSCGDLNDRFQDTTKQIFSKMVQKTDEKVNGQKNSGNSNREFKSCNTFDVNFDNKEQSKDEKIIIGNNSFDNGSKPKPIRYPRKSNILLELENLSKISNEQANNRLRILHPLFNEINIKFHDSVIRYAKNFTALRQKIRKYFKQTYSILKITDLSTKTVFEVLKYTNKHPKRCVNTVEDIFYVNKSYLLSSRSIAKEWELLAKDKIISVQFGVARMSEYETFKIYEIIQTTTVKYKSKETIEMFVLAKKDAETTTASSMNQWFL